MSKSTFIIGMLAAVAAHAALLWPLEGKSTAAEDSKPETKPPTVAVPPEPQEAETSPEPSQPKLEAEKAPIESNETPALKQVVDARADSDLSNAEGETSSKSPEDGLPPLRVVWQSVKQLRAVAAELGMRIVAVNSELQVLGEVTTQGSLRIVPFEGRLSAYSNRVRTLPRGFFGSGLAAGADVASFWVLLPADLDARFVLLQRDAIRREGLTPAEVRAVEAEFVPAGGTYQLQITQVLPNIP